MLLLYKTPYSNTVHKKKKILLKREIVTLYFTGILWDTVSSIRCKKKKLKIICLDFLKTFETSHMKSLRKLQRSKGKKHKALPN